jgi:hypothetical protein
MTVALRTLDELRSVPGLATLPALCASIDAFKAALGVSHPHLLDSPTGPRSPREGAAVLLHMYLDACQHLLHAYDQLTFDGTFWDFPDHQEDAQLEPLDPEDDIPF